MPSLISDDATAISRTVVVIPTYNEAANLPNLVAELRALAVPGLHLLIVDDNSPDGTGRLADELACRFPGEIHVCHRPGKQGLGRAYLAGFKEALAMSADAIVQMDADFSHPPTKIPEMLALLAQYDVVVGSRYVPGGQLDERWSWWRRFLSWWANEVWARRILRINTRDITAGFKCWRRATLLGIGLDRVQSNGYAFQVEMTYLTERLGFKVVEIPIYFEDRRIGKSKMSVPVKLQGAVDVLRIWWRHRHATRYELPADAREPERPDRP
ncbi:MAG: Undecaprenyl-phosphate mannosyltransferase [Chloroflexi bacterium ADurb.Bin325]|nr:MAG: Undecaprenyl-phosphate mannosyltransferase [Chloroflexi bacterium ADurb.Bin325]